MSFDNSKLIVTKGYLDDTADAIREQLETSETYNLSEFADAVRSISSGGYKLEDMPTGAIATITDAAALPLNDLKIAIEPVQSGSGDPSPQNERPITGWTECNISDVGTNMWDEEWEVGSIDAYGNPVTGSGYIRSKNFIRVVPSTTYFYNVPSSYSQYGWIHEYDENYNWIRMNNIYTQNAFTTANNCKYIKFRTVCTTYNNDISINYPSTDTSYHAYTGQTYNIEFPSQAGTVYGGTLDVTNGVLIVDSKLFNVNLASQITKLTTQVFRISKTLLPDGLFDTDSIDGVMCDKFKSALGNVYDDRIYRDTNGFIIRTSNTYESESAFYSGVGEFNIKYPLATPITYQLDPTSMIRLLEGLNNIFADTGDILEGEYFKAL